VHHIALLFRLEWLLRYHAALAHYHLKQYGPAAAALGRCLSTRVGDWSDGGGEGLRAHAHGEVAVGACLFHLGVASAHLGRLDAAAEALDGAARSAWARAAPPRAGPPLAHAPTEARLTHDHLRHQALCCFARAKVHQRRQQHGEAALLFTLALDISASSAAPDAGARFDSFALFRRGWAHRAMHDLRRAGEDFVAARQLQPFDPNFAIEYKHTDHVLYSELSHEPDITEPFLPLVVLPRSI
jgi:tetratricopeptide (TPR) repeat protein